MNENTPDPVEIAVLARLLVGARRAPSEADVVRTLQPLFAGTDRSRSAEQVRAALARLAERGLRAPDVMTLTAEGKQRAREVLGLGKGRIPTQWRALKGLLVTVALDKKSSKRVPTAAAVRAAALAKKLQIETTSSSPADVLDAWAAREMGMAGQRLTIANVRAHVLAQALGIASLRDPKRIGAVATAKVLGVPRTDAGTIRDSILRDWLQPPAPPPDAPAAAGLSPLSPLHTFATTVKDIARDTAEGRFGRHKVFIAPLWKRARDASSLGTMDEAEFKSRLVDAHRAGLLRLSRADLTPAMAPEIVAASEVPYLNAVFHFVDLEGTLS